MGDHWTDSISPLSRSRVDLSVLDVVGLAQREKANKPGHTVTTSFLGRRWLDGRKFTLSRGVQVDRSNGLQVLLPVSENPASASSVVSRRTGTVKFSPVFVPTGSVVNLHKYYSFQPVRLEEEFDIAVKDVNGLVLYTSPVSHFFYSYFSSHQFYHHLPAWVCGIVEKGRVLDMGGSQKSTRGKVLSSAPVGVARETERTNHKTNRTNCPIEEEIENYVCYTFATDTSDGWIEPDSRGLYSKEALAYFSGGVAMRFDTLSSTEYRGAMESGREVVGGLSKSFSMRNLVLEENRLKSQKSLGREELANGKGAVDLLACGSWEQNGAGIQSESEGSCEAGSSPVFDESFYMGPTQLEAELQATSDAIEEMEGKVAIRLMVAEAVLRGIVRAVEVDASEAVEISETQLLKVKQELQEKDTTVIELITTLKKKEEELVKLVEESRRKERRLVMDMLSERERILGKIKESEKYVAQKEKELLKMAEHMVELSLNLAAESKRVNVLEKQIKESKEAESRKGRELLAMMEKAEQFRAERESVLEMVRREARLKELRLTESLAEKEEVLSQQLETIRTLKAAEQKLRVELDVRNQKELQLTETLAEKDEVLSQQRETIRSLEAAEHQLREEVDGRSQKELELTETLAQKERVLSQQDEIIKSLETAEQKLREEVDVRSQKELCLSETLAEKESVLGEQLEAVGCLENSGQQLREELDVLINREEQLARSLTEKDKVVSQHLQTIETLESLEQQLRKELDDRAQKELELTQSLAKKENLVNKHLQTIRGLECAEAELHEKFSSESSKLQSLTEDLSAKERELSEQLETIESLRLAEKELREVVENHGQKERFLMVDLSEKDELISRQRTLITTFECTEQELKKEAEVQHEKVTDLLNSGKDSSEVLEKLRDTVKFQVDTIEEKDRGLRFFQSEIELLNCKVEDLSSVHGTLIGRIERFQREVEKQRVQIVKQEAIIRESEDRCQELSLREKRLQDEVASLNEKVLEFEDAAQLVQDDQQEQSWKHETETALIMIALEGRVMDLEKEIILFGEESVRNQAETVTFRSQILQRKHLEINNLRSSKLTLEVGLSDAQAALEVLEEAAKKQKEMLKNKDVLLKNADNRIAQLEQQLMKNGLLFQEIQREVEEMNTREEKLKERQQVLECEVQQLSRSLNSAALVEQELRAKESQLESMVQELEEKVWMLEFENMFMSSYLENTSQDILNLLADVNKRSITIAKNTSVLQLELEAAGVELSRSKEETDRLRSELSACAERMQSNLSSSAKDLAEVRARLEVETVNSGRLKAHMYELESQRDGLQKEFEVKLSRKEEETMKLMLSLEESKWQNEVESFIVIGVTEGYIQKLMENLSHARQEIETENEDIGVLRCEVEELRQKLRASASDNSELKAALARKTQELSTFKTDFVLQNAMQRDAHLQAQTKAREAMKKIEDLKRLKLTLLERIQEEKQRWTQAEEMLAEQKWKNQFEMEILSTVISEAEVCSAARDVGIDDEMTHSPREQLRGDDSKKANLSKDLSSGTDPTGSFTKGKLGRAKTEPKVSKVPLSELDLLVRENDELRREKEQLLTQKTEEIYRLKREFYKELENVKLERKKDYESDGSQKESPKSKCTSKPKQRAVTAPEVKQNDDYAKLEKVVADDERKVSGMRALWDAEKSKLQGSLSLREEEIKELSSNLSEKLEEVVADHDRKVSEMRALWDVEKANLLESHSLKEDQIKALVSKLSSQAQQNDDTEKFEKLVAHHEREVSEVRTLWDAEKSSLLESLSQREDEINELLQSQAQANNKLAELQKVVADHERKVSEMRARWDVEKSAIGEQIKKLKRELMQALEKEKDCLTRQSSLEENLAAVEEERIRLKMLHEEEIQNSAAIHRSELDVTTRQLIEAVKKAQEKSKLVRDLNDEVRQMKDEASVLRSEISSARKQMEIEFAGEVESLVASLHQVERGVTQRAKQYNLRLQRAHSLLSHLGRHCRMLVSSEADHMQNLQNLQKAEAEVDLLGDEVDALMEVLEKVYTVLSHYHPVIQHYPGLADLAKVVRNEVLQRLRDSDDVSL